ncbi:MAG: ABC transporter permease [Pirellulales bacterium]|nr:ABC transporter permease [Pirellulales bacterium]
MAIATPPTTARTTAAGQVPSPVCPLPWLAAWTLCRREWVRFIRQKNRVFSALGQPIIFWILFSSLVGTSFKWPGNAYEGSYSEYFFPGTLVMILLFTAIFATISVIEDRREGFLQAVLVAPIPRWSMVIGKVLGGTLIAVAHAAVFLLLGFWLGIALNLPIFLIALAYLFIVGMALTALGLAIAWPMQSTQGFHAIMMVFLLPLWLLSGAFFQPSNNWMAWVIALNPLTYCVAMLRRILYWAASADTYEKVTQELPPTWLCATVTLLFLAGTFALAWRVAAVRATRDAI